jgi:hypothetical protein
MDVVGGTDQGPLAYQVSMLIVLLVLKLIDHKGKT